MATLRDNTIPFDLAPGCVPKASPTRPRWRNCPTAGACATPGP
jgi:hypothetical protein